MNPWDMMGGNMPPMQMQQMGQMPQMGQMQQMGPPQQQQQQQKSQDPWDYPGVREAIGQPMQYTPYIPQELNASAPSQKVPWQDLMGAGYGNYL